MRYIKNLSQLDIFNIDESDFSSVKKFYFLFENRSKPMFFINSDGQYCGYLCLDLLIKNGCKKNDLDKINLNELDTYYIDAQSAETETNEGRNICPILSEEKLQSCIIKDNPSNIENYKFVLSIFPFFAGDFSQYLLSKGISDVYIDASYSDASYIQKLCPIINVVNQQYVPNKGLSAKHVIILKYDEQLIKQYFVDLEVVNLEELLIKFALDKIIPYTQKNDIHVYFIEGPDIKKLNYKKENEPYLESGKSLEIVLEDKEYVFKFCNGNVTDFEYLTDPKEGLLGGNRITYNGINLLSAFFESKNVNVNRNGERKTIKTSYPTPENKVFVYGSCLSFGLFASDDETFPSYLQQIYNSKHLPFQVVNKGVKGRNNILNDLIFAMNTEMKKGDAIIFLNLPNKKIKEYVEDYGYSYINYTDHLNKILKPFSFLNSAFHTNKTIYKDIAEFCYELHHDVITYDNSEVFSFSKENNMIDYINQDYFLSKVFVGEYLEYIKSRMFKIEGSDKIVGSAVLAANPFTKGHAQLIDYIVTHSDYSYIFVIDDGDFDFTPEQRFKMVSEYCKKYSNCRVYPTGKFFGAAFLFPEYHSKDLYKTEDKKIENPEIDTIIFAKHIAPLLGINKRYLGDEMSDNVTYQYNNYLLDYLPKNGIQVEIIKRFGTGTGERISGSKVRELIFNHSDIDVLSNYLPSETIEVVKDYI